MRLRNFFLLSLLLILLGGFFTWSQKGIVSKGSRSIPKVKTGIRQQSLGAIVSKNLTKSATPFTTQYQGVTETFVLALDEAVERLPEGEDQVVIIDPPATEQTLASRLAELETENLVHPVLYRESEEGIRGTRHIVTRDLTIELSDSESLPPLPAGITLKERPSFAPNHAVVSAADPFAAMAALRELQITPGIDEVEIQLAVQYAKKALPNDPLVSQQWHLRASGLARVGSDLNIEDAWRYDGTDGVRGRGIRIGIVDDGLQTTHPDLVANVNTLLDFDWNGNDNDPTPNPNILDFHGTSCAGIAGAVGNNGIGVSGTAPESTLVGMRLISAAVSDFQQAQAMAHRSDMIQIKSNSWGPPDSGEISNLGILTRSAIANAADTGRDGRGTIFVWAAGNGRRSQDDSNYDGFANNIHTIAVAATNSRGEQASYSEPGANLVVAGSSSGLFTPTGITTTDLVGAVGYQGTDYTDDFGGTSASAPAVAGIIALMLERNPELGWRDVQEILLTSARMNDPADPDWTENGAGLSFNHKYGAGLADASAAVELAADWENLAEATSSEVSQTNINQTIPDNNAAGVSIDFTIEGEEIRCEHVTLQLTANHLMRGNLAVTLTSPSGTVSRLAEARRTDTRANYQGFTFSSVRHWGEPSTGTWTVNVSDREVGNTGLLNALTLIVHGAAAAPGNPGPEVAITTPTADSSFSPGSTIDVSIEATDLTIDGDPGSVASVELFDGLDSLGIDSAAPFEFSFSPGLGAHSLTAVAIDNEGEATTSEAVTFIIADQIPTVSAANLSPAPQAFADQELSITDLAGNDPEGQALTYNYRWENSADGEVWNETAITSSILPASPNNAGLLWRAQVRSNDGISDSAPYTTNATNCLNRPPASSQLGENFSYQSGLVLRRSNSTLNNEALINEFSQGEQNGAEWFEILVLRETSLRNWALSDANFTLPLRFADVAAWDEIRAGTSIVIYNGNTRDALLPPDDFDASDFSLVVPSTATDLFNGSWPSFGDQGDAVILRDSAGAIVMQFSYGNRTSPSPNLGSARAGESIYYTGSNESDAISPSFWSTTPATVTRNPRAIGATASLPLEFGGPWDGLPLGFTSSGVGFFNSNLGDDTAPGSARFDSTGDQLVIQFDAPAQTLSYRLRGSAGGQNVTEGSFLIEESNDGVNYQALRVLNNLGPTDQSYLDTPNQLVRYIRFQYLAQVSGNIQLDQIQITEGSALGNEALSLTLASPIILENAGANATTGILRIEDPQTSDLEIALSSQDPSQISVPPIATIAAGELSTTFPLSIIDDNEFSGNRSLIIEAFALGFTLGRFNLTIIDDEENLIGVTPGIGNNFANNSLITDLRSGAFSPAARFRLGTDSTLPDGLSLNENTGEISGIISPSETVGNFPITIERFNLRPENVSLSFTLAVNPVSNFSTWVAEQGITDTTINADPDGDGLENLLEYFLAGNPGQASQEEAPELIAGPDSVRLGFWHLKSATDVTGTVEWSDTLEADSWTSTGVTSEITIDEPTREYIEATIPAGSPSRFVRLRVE